MVVEPSAATFLNARVIAVDGTAVRLQLESDGRTLHAQLGDLYSLADNGAALSVPGVAICRDTGAWYPCRIDSMSGGIYAVEFPHGKQRLARPELLQATGVTAINVRRFFRQRSKRSSFAKGASRAGAPSAPDGWHPRPGDPVLVAKDGYWFAGRVLKRVEDGLRVRLLARAAEYVVPAERIIPVPPYKGDIEPGGYVLVEGGAAADAWKLVRVEERRGAKLRVRDEHGHTNQVARVAVVPLRRHRPAP